jgi:hypothetical protein
MLHDDIRQQPRQTSSPNLERIYKRSHQTPYITILQQRPL